MWTSWGRNYRLHARLRGRFRLMKGYNVQNQSVQYKVFEAADLKSPTGQLALARDGEKRSRPCSSCNSSSSSSGSYASNPAVMLVLPYMVTSHSPLHEREKKRSGQAGYCASASPAEQLRPLRHSASLFWVAILCLNEHAPAIALPPPATIEVMNLDHTLSVWVRTVY